MEECDRGTEELTDPAEANTEKGNYHTVLEATIIPVGAPQLRAGDAILWARLLMIVDKVDTTSYIVHAHSLTDNNFLPIQRDRPEGQLKYLNYYKVLRATYALPCNKCGGCGDRYPNTQSEEDMQGPIRCDACSGTGDGEKQSYPSQATHTSHPVAPCCEKDNLFALFVDPETNHRHTRMCIQTEIKFLREHSLPASRWKNQMTIRQRIQQLQRITGETVTE